MGNRAVITTRENFENNGIGIYLHWNGGRDSVEAFLKYCEIRGYRAPNEDNYGWARLTQVIANFFGSNGLSVGIDTVNHLDCDNGDNGVYFIEGWKIVGRKYAYEEQDTYELIDMLKAIDEAQPEPIGADYFDGEDVAVSELAIGDTVYVRDWSGEFKRLTVTAFGEDRYCNGTNVKGLPFVDLCGNGMIDNINNYLRAETVRRVRG